MEYDPLIKKGAEIIFYVALVVLFIVWILKKRKQVHTINENTPHNENNSDEK